jgi:hypothetical protein
VRRIAEELRATGRPGGWRRRRGRPRRASPSGRPARTDGSRDVASLADLRRDGRRAITIDGHELALFLVGSEVRCLGGLCPHEGGPMAQGEVIDGVVSCRGSGW